MSKEVGAGGRFDIFLDSALGFVAIGPGSDLLDAYNVVDYGGISGGRHLHTVAKLKVVLVVPSKAKIFSS